MNHDCPLLLLVVRKRKKSSQSSCKETDSEDPPSKEKRFKCPVEFCDSSYCKKSSLTVHDRTVHQGIKFVCDHCDKEFCYQVV